MVASSCTMSATMCSRATWSNTLISVSSRSRASGVRRSCEMPASITARSCSSLDRRSLMRLKPMFTSRISLVTASSSSCAAKSPSRSRLVALESCLSGRLMRPAITAAPASDSAAAVSTHTSQVLPPAGLKREGSIRNQFWSPSMVKPTHRPSSPLTLLATMVLGPRRLVTSWVRRAPSGVELSMDSYTSLGSRGTMRTPSWSAMVLTRETRAMASECISAARLRLTSEAICWAVWMARGSVSSERRVCTQARMLPVSRMASRKKVRQKRLRPTRVRLLLCAAAVVLPSSGARPDWSGSLTGVGAMGRVRVEESDQ